MPRMYLDGSHTHEETKNKSEYYMKKSNSIYIQYPPINSPQRFLPLYFFVTTIPPPISLSKTVEDSDHVRRKLDSRGHVWRLVGGGCAASAPSLWTDEKEQRISRQAQVERASTEIKKRRPNASQPHHSSFLERRHVSQRWRRCHHRGRPWGVQRYRKTL